MSGSWSVPGNWSPQAIPSAGDSLVFPAGVPNLWMTNDLPSGTVGPMTFNASAYTIAGNPLTLTGDVVNTAGGLLFLVPLKIGASVRLTGSYATDKVDVNGQTLTIDGPLNVNSLNGSGTVNVKILTQLTVLGDGTFNGTINGAIRLAGSMPNANVIIGSGAIIGEGTLGNVTVNGGDLDPLVFGVGPGVIHTKSLAMNSGDYDVRLVTSGASSKVYVTGSVFLNCSFGPWLTGSPILGQAFTIIDNDGTDPVVGTFIGAPEGAIIPNPQGVISGGNGLFKISYAGGDGNDVVLTTVGGTATTLTQSSVTTSFGDPFTVTASVTSDAGTVFRGLVVLYNGPETVAIVPVQNGTATWTTSDRGAGTHNITAAYQPSHYYFGSTSNVVTHSVQPRTTTTTIATSSASPRYGDAVTFSATVAPSPFTALANGTVLFEADGVALGTVAVANGSASFVTSVLNAGVHSIVAKYSGDANFAPSVSVLGQTVAMAHTEVTADFLSAFPTALQQVVRAIVRVPDHPSLTAKGTVTVSESGVAVAEDLLSGGEVTMAVPGLPAGPHHLVVTFSGNSNFESSSTSVDPIIVLPRLSVSSIAIAEGNTGVQVIQLIVQLTAPSAKTVRVAYTTIDGSARAGLDYETSQGVIEFPPGETVRAIALHVFGDTVPEPDQSFAVVLSDSANAEIGNGIGTVTILNDDGPVPPAPRGRPSRH